MLDPFVSTRPRDTERPTVLLLSITAHVILVYAALTPQFTISHAGGEIIRDRTPVIERIRFLELAPPPTAPETRAPTKVVSDVPVRPMLPKVQMPSIDPIAIAAAPPMPNIDFSSKVNEIDSAVVSAPRVPIIAKGIVGDAASIAAHTGPYTKDDVDKIVVPFGNNPKPVYPWHLQRQGVQASFVAQFVVDSTGRMDEQSLLFPPGANKAFVEAVRRALQRSRYHPAEMGGRRVMQLVEQRFSFVLVQGHGEIR